MARSLPTRTATVLAFVWPSHSRAPAAIREQPPPWERDRAPTGQFADFACQVRESSFFGEALPPGFAWIVDINNDSRRNKRVEMSNIPDVAPLSRVRVTPNPDRLYSCFMMERSCSGRRWPRPNRVPGRTIRRLRRLAGQVAVVLRPRGTPGGVGPLLSVPAKTDHLRRDRALRVRALLPTGTSFTPTSRLRECGKQPLGRAKKRRLTSRSSSCGSGSCG